MEKYNSEGVKTGLGGGGLYMCGGGGRRDGSRWRQE